MAFYISDFDYILAPLKIRNFQPNAVKTPGTWEGWKGGGWKMWFSSSRLRIINKLFKVHLQGVLRRIEANFFRSPPSASSPPWGTSKLGHRWKLRKVMKIGPTAAGTRVPFEEGAKILTTIIYTLFPAKVAPYRGRQLIRGCRWNDEW